MNKSPSADGLVEEDLFMAAAPAGLAPRVAELESLPMAIWGSKILWVTLHAVRGIPLKDNNHTNIYVFGWLGPRSETQKPNSTQRKHRLVYKSEKKKSSTPTWDHECWEFTSKHLTSPEDVLHVQVWNHGKGVGKSDNYLGDTVIDVAKLREDPSFSRDGKNFQQYMASQWRPLQAMGKRAKEKVS